LGAERRRFFALMDQRLVELDAVTRDFDRAEHERHGYYLRRMLWEFLLTSEIHRRTNLKPRGYAGDAEMMELLYENRWAGRTVFSKLLHKHAVEQPAAQAVRNRRQLICRQLTERFSQPGEGAAPVRALSVACGPAWELRDLFQHPEDADRLHLTLLDQDPVALDCARACVAEREAALGRALPVAYVADSVRTMIRTPRIAERFGRFDFIYSMGLFDYLTPPVAKAVVGRLFEQLAPGGRLVVGNYHAENPSRWYMAYWLDWALYYRTEEEFLALAGKLQGHSAAVSFDASGCQMFLTVDRDR
jgi:extracellular factor (EF) 3-hydroxypalmitic acid methyl ester biosynthesis protein